MIATYVAISESSLRSSAIDVNFMRHGIWPLRVVTSRNDDHNRKNARQAMPFLLWMPIIVMSGMWKIAEENSRAFLRASPPSDE